MAVNQFEIMMMVKNYFKDHPEVAFDDFVKETKTIYQDIEHKKIKPYEPIKVEAINKDFSSYQTTVRTKETHSIEDEEL